MTKREIFKNAIIKKYGNKQFTKEQAQEVCSKNGLSDSDFRSITSHVLRKIKVEKGVFSFPADHAFGGSKKSSKVETKKTSKVIKPKTTKEVPVEEFIKDIPETVSTTVPNIPSISSSVVNLKPESHEGYVTHGNHKDVKSVIKSKMFYPIFITGLSGNGKTLLVHQICHELKRDMIRVNITIETDEDDLLGGFRLVDGETVWHDGPVVSAMENGSVLLLDEIDLASHKVMCLQPVLEGKPIYLKKVNRYVYPKAGFTVVATANTKGKGSDDGRFMGTNILNEAFLDRFPVTLYQDYPTASVEQKILSKIFEKHDAEADTDFVEKLCKWSDVIRKTFADGGCDEVITTRRLVNVIEAFLIFKNKVKAIEMCVERFDDDTKLSFTDLYKKIDGGIDPLAETTSEEETEIRVEEENEVPF